MKMFVIGFAISSLLAAAESDTVAGTSSVATSSGVRVATLLHEHVGFEARAHVQMSRWCNTTIAAQENRRNALHRLLSQAQVSQSVDGSTSETLSKLRADAASLDKEIEEARLNLIAKQSSDAKDSSHFKLSLQDAMKDVEALQKSLTHLGGGSAPTSAAVEAAASLLAQAQETKKQLQKQVVLLQAHTGASIEGNMSRMLSKYNSKKAEIVAYQQQFFTTQRSLDVLTSALEDESEYLADLRSVCSAESRVHQRLEKHVLPTLQSLPQKSSPVLKQSAKLSTPSQTSKPASANPSKAAGKSVLAAAIPAAAKPPKAAGLVSGKRALKAGTSKQAAQSSTKVMKSIVSKSIQKSPRVETHAKMQAKVVIKDPFEDDSDDDAPHASQGLVTKVGTKQHSVAKSKESNKPVSSHLQIRAAPTLVPSVKSHSQIAARVNAHASAKIKDPFADDDDRDDDDVVPAAKSSLVQKVATKPQSRVSEPVQAKIGTKVKDPFADDDEDGDDEVVPTAKPKLAKKTLPILRQAQQARPRVAEPVHAKIKDPFADDDDDAGDDEAVPMAKPKLAKKTLPILRQAQQARPRDVESVHAPAGTKMKDPFADDDDDDDNDGRMERHATPAVSKKSRSVVALQEGTRGGIPSPQKALAQTGAVNANGMDSLETKADINDDKVDSADSVDEEISSSKPGAAVSAMKEELEVDEAIAEPSPDQSSTVSQPVKLFTSKSYDASHNALPTQYAAWTPSAKTTAEQRKKAAEKAALAEMGGDFDDDDDAPKPVARMTHHHGVRSPPSPPPPKPSADGVVYDDDDLPRHRTAVRRLEGGWEALMKHDSHAARAPKLDPDVAIMESLYGKDGSLPSQYTAWTPDDVPKPAPPPPPTRVDSTENDASPGETMDLEATAKAFAKDPESAFDFLQVAADSENPVSAMISHVANAAGSISFRGSAVLLEASTAKIDLSRMAVASTVLAQYAEVLQSRPLKQLAKAQLKPQKLRALYQQLSNVDPLSAKAPTQAQGRQAQAEKMCNYLESHMQAAAPVQKALTLLQNADNELGTFLASQAAIQEEADARTQLEKTVAQDVSNLKALKGVGKQGADSFPFRLAEKSMSVATAADVGASFANIEGAHAEVQDLLDTVLQKRTAVLQSQHQKLLQLKDETKQINAEVMEKTRRVAASQAEMEAIRKKLSGLSASCGMTMDALARRRHNGHMEAHAIEVTLKVLGLQ